MTSSTQLIMVRKLLFSICGILFLAATAVFGQGVGIGTVTPDNSAALEISSDSAGILIPRMTVPQRDAIIAPADGLMIYNVTDSTFNYYNGNTWQEIGGSTGHVLVDVDTDTKIMVEETPDEDIIRFITRNENAMLVDSTGRVGIGVDDPASKLHMSGALLVEDSIGSTPVSGMGVRMMWVPDKAAFRAGQVDSVEWDSVNIGKWSSVTGGRGNRASGTHSVVGGGYLNSAIGVMSIVSGGAVNEANSSFSYVGGGAHNIAQNDWSTVAGGYFNLASGLYSFVGGGSANHALGEDNAIGGGWNNRTHGFQSGIFSGRDNTTNGNLSAILGGLKNEATSPYSTVAGGAYNTARGYGSIVLGGYSNTAFSYGESVVGVYSTEYVPNDTANWHSDDRVFAIGNGVNLLNRSNALTVYKSGTININDAYDLPNIDGVDGQVLGTDGLGEVSWVSVSVVPKDADADTRVEVEALNDEDIIRLITRNNDGLIVDSVGHVGIGMAVPPARLSVAGGLLLDGAIGSAPSLGPGNRFMWIPDKAALRAGAVNGNQWQPDSIGFYSSVTGGLDNKVKGQYSTITGGQENVVLERWSAVGGGKQNTVKGQYSVISGGQSNEIDGSGSVIAGGNANYSEGSAATVSGGEINEAIGQYATISGGFQNLSWQGAAVGGGRENSATGSNSVVAGGLRNQVTGYCSTVGGGLLNYASQNTTVVAGGNRNKALAHYATVAGGNSNEASGGSSFIGGGADNETTEYAAAVAGGSANQAHYAAFVGGGFDNIASGDASAIPGGQGLFARSYGETVVGLFNTDYTPADSAGFDASDRLFVVGNGPAADSTSNAMIVYKDGTLNINDAYNLPNTDGANGQFLKTDGAGNVSWGASTIVADADNDTRVQVEGAPDDDVIRFDIGGTQHFSMHDGRIHFDNTGGTIALGNFAGADDDHTANRNVLIGEGAGQYVNSGAFNSVIGYRANRANKAGVYNSVLGYRALEVADTSSSNVAIGRGALQFSTEINNTVAVGFGAGRNAEGTGGVFLGFAAGENEANSNRLYIENSNASSTGALIYGEFDNDLLTFNADVGIGTNAPMGALHVVGDAYKTSGGTTWSVPSDMRLKDVGEKYTAGIDEIMKLRTVHFKYKENNAKGLPSEVDHIGFVAQEVQQVLPEAVTTGEEGYLTLQADPIYLAMLNAIQEQQRVIERLEDRVRSLEDRD